MKKFMFAAIAVFIPSIASAGSLPSCDGIVLERTDCVLNKNITLIKSVSGVERNCSKVSSWVTAYDEGWAKALSVSVASIKFLDSYPSKKVKGYCCVKIDTPKGPFVGSTNMLTLSNGELSVTPGILWLSSQIFNPMLFDDINCM